MKGPKRPTPGVGGIASDGCVQPGSFTFVVMSMYGIVGGGVCDCVGEKSGVLGVLSGVLASLREIVDVGEGFVGVCDGSGCGMLV